MTMQTINQASLVEQTIRQFYDLLNAGLFARCYRMIDPSIRADPTSVTLPRYEESLSAFQACVGKVRVCQVEIDLHIGEPSKLYDNHDFAVGKTTWEDERAEQHVHQERYVCRGQSRYTRSTGLVAPSQTRGAQPGS